jgi:regulation of enolase protein 1 (concanavalin A-like superfamily)/endonuclease/exonuclease/phosphatase family metal-dependent hydrolase
VYTWNIDTVNQSDAYARGQMDYIVSLNPRPQVVIIQEAHPELWPASYAGELSSRTGDTWTGVFARHCAAASGTTCTSLFGDNGVAIMTSLPVVDQSTAMAFHCDYYVAGRAMARLAVNDHGTVIQVFGTHLQADDPHVSSSCPTGGGEAYPSRQVERAASVRDLVGWAAGYPAPRLIGGDFNARPTETAIADAGQGMTASYADGWARLGSGSGLSWKLNPGCDTRFMDRRIDYWFSDTGGIASPQAVDQPGLSGCFGGWPSDHIGLRAQYTIGLPTTSWVNQDVGAVGTPGSASSSGSAVWTANGAGSDIWGTADSFQFVHQTLSGDGQITARVDSLQNTSVFAKAGVMMRDGLGAGAAHVILDIRPTGDVEFMQRSAAGGTTTFLATASAPTPYWVRLGRASGVITASISQDGKAWVVVGATGETMGAALEVGLAVASHDTSTLNRSTFEGVSLLSTPWTDQDVGAVGITGNASYNGGLFTVAGAGADIWSASDALHFVYRTLSGDGQITARVHQVQNTSTFAKAGVMMRDGLGANAAHVILDLRPNGSIEFMRRGAAGGNTTFIATGAGPWVRLSRSGNTVTAMTSADGSIWAPIGSVTVSMSSTIEIGLAVTSHDTTRLNTSLFSGVR